MMTLQDLGLSILGTSPKSLYFIGGTEYGVKSKYIERLTKLYGAKEEYPSMDRIISLFSTKHLLPLKPQLYVVRYDEQFIQSLTAEVAKKVTGLKIVGTVVCIYEDAKHVAKLDKYFPDNVGVVESINPKFIEKYLHSDFPNLDDRSINIAALSSDNYSQAKNICESMSHTEPQILASMPQSKLELLFGCTTASADNQLRIAIASRNFNAFVSLLDSYEGDLDNVMYIFLQTCIDLEKTKCTKYNNTDLKDYVKYWGLEDIYYMFMHSYNELSKLRSNTSANVYDSLIMLASLFTFKSVPSLEALNGI